MDQNMISFKGNKDGIYIQIKEGDFNLIKNQLINKLETTKEFFQGAKVVDIKGGHLLEEEFNILVSLIEEFGIEVEIVEKELIEEDIEEILPFDGIDIGNTKFLRHTLRSGQRVEFDGNIVVLGDTNPGSVIVAKGNIIIMGALRGIAHAGSDGNKEAIVAAFQMKPNQLRIADIIARSPDNEILSPQWPEIAKIKDNTVMIEPYLQKK
ncbi:septum site-determining protein MinC [Clostridium sp. D2Q-11]|uniref:Probable septum site-determining protein MinC n=1 Tax=Anaeromonas frigoriresistens TaxID=2683708 RepID=A0A942Z7R5_9FIRM|nr:septum site-determining protein MinC [Anaeromonas frigoriresistens]MBS4537174.1 septum site-determining protein MinC [Anaeromonas frigoriresistens]